MPLPEATMLAGIIFLFSCSVMGAHPDYNGQ